MNNPRILFIAPSSYPIFGAEANVNAKLLKTLSENGAIIDLVCRGDNRNQGYPKSTDGFYFDKLNSINIVFTTPKLDLKTFSRYCRTLFKFGTIYRGIDWAIDALPVCEKLLKEQRYDFIYTFNQPSEVLGVYLSKKYSIPWVATWNDPYVWSKYPAPYGKGAYSKLPFLRKKLIIAIEKTCSYHVFPSNRLMTYMQKYMKSISECNSLICPHIMLEKNHRDHILNTKLKIIHSGALGKERDPMIFLKALKQFIINNPSAQIEITFLGVFERIGSTYIESFIEESGLKEYVNLIPPVTYNESLLILKNYDISLILEANCEEGIFLPSKVADYKQVDIPIFTVSPLNGVLNDLYRVGEIEYFADVKDESMIQSTINEIYTDFINNKIKHIDSLNTHFSPITILEVHKKIWN